MALTSTQFFDDGLISRYFFLDLKANEKAVVRR